ncbi:hypothetical protein [Bryobacter aggregatus]|uniref:hypothetical protein n=1 Tax=Bryobacter aggregatus TaxID=360054 RepID=UPI0004E1B741|nr:hypothetical protein [Bryobacter aggregatus]
MSKPLVWLVAALGVPYLFLLAASGIFGADEPRYAAIAHQMAASGDWITPTLWGEAWFEKPPLTYWLIASFDRLGFSPDLAVRLPIALLGLGFLFALPSLEAAFVLGTSVGWLAISQVGVTDIPLSVCFNLWLLGMLRGRPWLAGVALGAAVLAKGLVPLVLGLPIALLYWREWRHWVACVFTAAPWYVACYVVNGRAFFDEFIVRHHIQRFLSPDLQHVQPWWFYLPVLLGLLFPWAPALLKIRNPEKPYLYTALWGLFFLSVSTNKLPAYVLPLLPSLAILIAPRLQRWHYSFAAGFLVLLPSAAPWLPTAIDEGLSKASLPTTAWIWLLVSPVAAYLAWRWQRPAVVAAMAIAICCLKWQLYPQLERKVSAREVWLTQHPTCVPDQESRGFRYSLFYYAGRELPLCSVEGRDQPR